MNHKAATPLVAPLERLSYLSTVPLLSRIGSNELLALAEPCEEMSFGPGDKLFARDEEATHVHILVSGRATVRQDGRTLRTLLEHDSVGLLSVLGRRSEPLETIAATGVRTLAISAQAFRDVLEDRFPVYHALLRNLCKLLHGERRQLESRGQSSSPTAAMKTFEPTTIVGRLLLLQVAFPFGFDHPMALSQMATRAEIIALADGERLWSADDPATGVYAIASGGLVCRDDSDEFNLAAGQSCGFIDAIAEATRSYDAKAVGTTTVLRIGREAILDVLEDHLDLADSCLEAISSSVIVAMDERAQSTEKTPIGLLRGLRANTADMPNLSSSTLHGLKPATRDD